MASIQSDSLVQGVEPSFAEELAHLGQLAPIGTALANFVEKLSPGGHFAREGSRWVYRPNNFVAFTVQYKRKKSLVLVLRGYLSEFKASESESCLKDAWLELEKDRATYSRYTITDAGQLLYAAYFIRRAFVPRRRSAKAGK